MKAKFPRHFPLIRYFIDRRENARRQRAAEDEVLESARLRAIGL